VDRGAWINAWAVGNGRNGNGVSASNEIQAAPKLLDGLDVKRGCGNRRCGELPNGDSKEDTGKGSADVLNGGI
jgi:hypothetical protein